MKPSLLQPKCKTSKKRSKTTSNIETLRERILYNQNGRHQRKEVKPHQI